MTKIYFQVVKRVLQQWTIQECLRKTQLLQLLWLSVDINAKVILIASHMLTTWSQRTALWFSKYKTSRQSSKENFQKSRQSSKENFQIGTTIQNVKRQVSIMIGLIDHFHDCITLILILLMFPYHNLSLGCGSNTDCPESHYCRHSLLQDPTENKTESRCVKASNNIRIISESKLYTIILFYLIGPYTGTLHIHSRMS